MKRTISTVAALLLLVAAIPAMAGDHQKCDQPAEACLKAYTESLQNRGWVGIEMDTNEDGSMKIVRVVPDSPAEAAGFEAGDVLASFNGLAYKDENKQALKEATKSMTPGKTVTYTVVRNGSEQDLKVELGSIPETVMAQWIGQHMLTAHVDPSEDQSAGG
ncbi:MAG: PDZ domain-containing protein [Thermoanaerobaculia bacterium]